MMESTNIFNKGSRVIAGLLGMMCLVSACSSGDVVNSGADASSPPNGSENAKVDLSVAAVQGDCTILLPGEERVSLLTATGHLRDPLPLTRTVGDRDWMSPTRLVSSQPDETQPWLHRAVLVGEIKGVSTGEVSLLIGEHELLAIVENLDGGSPVLIGLTSASTGPYPHLNKGLDYYAGPALVESVDGPIVTGNCGAQLERSLRARFTADYPASMAELVRAESTAEVAELLGESPKPAMDPVEPDVEHVLLNPASTSDDVLSRLNEGLLVISVDPTFREDGLICTKTGAGWNDCVPTELDDLQVGVDLNIYIDDAGLLEVFFLPGGVDIIEPPQLIGSLRIDPELLESSDLTAIRLNITGRSTSDVAAELLKVDDFQNVLDGKATGWEALQID